MSGQGDSQPVAGEGDTTDCRLDFRTHLTNPSPEAVAKIRPGTVLMLALDPGPAIVCQYEGERVGSLTTRVPTLLRCLREGNTYSANVLSVDGGSVEVNVRNS
jgi:hypothetical protein